MVLKFKVEFTKLGTSFSSSSTITGLPQCEA